MYEEMFITTKAIVAAVCWLVVSAGAGLAIFTPSIKDTLMERICLAAIAITAVGTACRIVSSGWITDGAAAVAFSLAVYVLVIATKHSKVCQYERKS